jgi:hypothetical protein
LKVTWFDLKSESVYDVPPSNPLEDQDDDVETLKRQSSDRFVWLARFACFAFLGGFAFLAWLVLRWLFSIQ